MSLQILKPDRVVAETEVVAVQAVDATGSFALLPGHEDFCTALVPSILTYRELGGANHVVAVDGGVLILEGGKVSVVTRDAVVADSVEGISDTVASMLRARREHEQEAAMLFKRLVAELLQQLPQLQVPR